MSLHNRTLDAHQPADAFLPYAVHHIEVDGLQVAVHDTGEPFPAVASDWNPQQPPLLLIHSINAAASAFEWKPFIKRQARQRRVVAVDLPSCGLSAKPDLVYTPQRMSAAIAAVIDWMGAAQVDMAALSLGCEFATLAALQQPQRVRSLALVSPTGMEGRRAKEKFENGRSRGSASLRKLLRNGSLGRLLYRLLTTRLMIHFFMARSWGTQAYDKRLLQQARNCAQQPGAHRVALDFISGTLFTHGIIERYRAVPVPMWVAHGRRGAFTDFGACPHDSGPADQGHKHVIKRYVFDGGAMPQFEWPDAFNQAYRRFLLGLAPGSRRFQPARSAPQRSLDSLGNANSWGPTAGA